MIFTAKNKVTCMPIVSVDRSESEKSLSDSVTQVFIVKKYDPTPVFGLEFGLSVCSLERQLKLW